jgi:pimeloyl-ACP methyl ester carboxylesterase
VAYNQIPEQANHFLYDWRADLRYNAALLADFIEQRRPPEGRWNLIGHSQGGLLIALASKLFVDREAFSELVTSATLVGPPLAGTMNAFAALLDGENAGKEAASRFKAVLRTFPSLYQMLPAWPAVRDPEGEVAPPERQLTHPGGWDDLPGIDEDLLSRIEPVQEALRDPLSHMKGDVRATIVLARNRNTVVEIQRGVEGLEEGERLSQKGDSLVPYKRTLSWLGDHIKPFVRAFKSGVNQHAFMLNDPAVVPVVLAQSR